jgi:hypothetical protein
MSTPAGWYPDPTGRHQHRWFDGDDWTDQIADDQVVGDDPVRGGGDAPVEPAADPAATQAVPEAQPQPTPVGGPPAGPSGPYVPPPGTEYAAAPASSKGGPNKGLLIGLGVLVVLVIVGLVLVLGGGDDGGEQASDDTEQTDDQSDSPETTEADDPSASDLFDDMADNADDDGDDGDIFGTDDEPPDEPADTTPDGSYPQEVIDNFTSSCQQSGGPADYCGCIIDVLQRDVAYDRFVEIDQQLAEDPSDIPAELDAAVNECQGG